jgi:hypothetical protein
LLHIDSPAHGASERARGADETVSVIACVPLNEDGEADCTSNMKFKEKACSKGGRLDAPELAVSSGMSHGTKGFASQRR